ncbi:hypothetical protein ANO11243_076390 [Dothideomycetidae sp. 11243]|nr:hypothetical protein ANO11243_076390 [fungal sp. No.11243]
MDSSSSSNSLAAFRKTFGSDLGALAEEHYRHDLLPTDRETLLSAAKSASTYATIGSALGIATGLLLALRIRRNRANVFAAFRAADRPTHVSFADGRLEPLPDLAPMMSPSRVGDVLTYTLFSFGGLFIGGELGLLGGGVAARRAVSADPESRRRIETAFRKFRADMLRKQADLIDKGHGELGI